MGRRLLALAGVVLVAGLALVAAPVTTAVAASVPAMDTTSDPAAVSWGTGRIDVFARSTKGTLLHKWFEGGWFPWQDLGGAITSGPAAASWASGRLDVFARGTDNTLQHIAYSGGVWSAWQGLGGGLSSAPAAVSWASNRIDVFVRGTDNAVWHKWWNGSWSGWESQGGTLTSAPAVASWASGRLDVFGRGTNNALYHKSFSGSWSAWQSLGGVLTSGPGAVSWAANRIDIFVRGGGNVLEHKWWNGSWSGWQSLGGGMASSPAAASWASGRLDVFSRGTGNTLQLISYSGSWSAWQTLLDGGPAGPPVSIEQFARVSAAQATPVPGASIGTLEYAYVDNIGRLLHGHQTDLDNFSSLQWTVISGNDAFSGQPALGEQADGRLQVTSMNIDRHVWFATQTTKSPPVWGSFIDVGGSMNSAPAFARLADGTLAAFIVDVNGRLWSTQQSGPNKLYFAWRDRGDVDLAGAPTAVTVSSGIQLFARNASGALLTALFANGALSAWTNLGGSGLTGSPAVVINPGWMLRVFVRGADGTILTKMQDSTGAWPQSWDPVGTFVAAGSPTALLSPVTGRTEVVARATDGTLFSTGETQPGSHVWRDWVSASIIDPSTGLPETAATDPTSFAVTGATYTWAFIFLRDDGARRVYTVTEVIGLAGAAAAEPVSTVTGHTLAGV